MYKLNIEQVYAPTISYSEEDISSFYETLGKANHYTIVMGNFNAKINREKNKPYRNGNGQIWGRIEKRQRQHQESTKSRIPCFRRKPGGDGLGKAQAV